MSKELIAVDIDEVLFPFLPEFLRQYNSMYSTEHELDHFMSYEFEHTLGLNFDETVKRVYQFNAQNSLHIEPIRQSAEAVKCLSEKYDLSIVTARHPKHAGVTRNWVNKYFPNMFNEIVPIGHPQVMGRKRTKAEVCAEMGAFALIDDSVEHVETCAENGIEGVLFGDYPWNKTNGNLHQSIIRCENWEAVKEHFNA
jgi:5'(3')-deoxyribonucleotidase